MANEYRYNLNVDLLLRNTLYKWTHNLSAVPELTQDATPLFQLKPPYNIAPFLTEFVLLSLLLLSTCRVSPSPVLTWHNTFGLQQSSYTVFHTHTAFSFGGRCSSVRPGRFGVRNPTGPKFAAPIQTGPEAQPAPCSVRTMGLFSWGYSSQGVALTTHLHLAPWLQKTWSYIPLSSPHLHVFIASRILNYTFTFYFLFRRKVRRILTL